MIQQDNQYQIPASILEDSLVYPQAEQASTNEHPTFVSESLPQFKNGSPAAQERPRDEDLARRFYEIVSANYETTPDPRYQAIKAIEQSFVSFRSTATEDNVSQTALEKVRNLLGRNKSLEERLVDQESIYGGEVFAGPPFRPDPEALLERFWYLHDRWYYEVQYAEKPTVVISYQVTETDVFKAVNGTTTPMVAGELDSLYVATGLARDTVRQAMYLLDDTLADLENETAE